MEKEKVDYRNSITLGLGNYYGYVELNKTDDKYYLTLGCHSSMNAIEIDSQTYNNLLKFKNQEPFKY